MTNGTNPADVHKVIDPDDKHFFFSGKVINGGLVLAAHLVDPDGKRSKNIRGRDAYDMMLKHFEGKFTVISDVWAQNPEFGDNIDLFNRLVSEGVRPEVAATKTWSGQQAIRNGYKLKSLTTRGLPGEYIWVMARWEPK